MTNDSHAQIVIVGGSLSGLTFALACASNGIHTRVLERAKRQYRSGAALGIDRPLLMRVIGQDPTYGAGVAGFPLLTQYRNAVSWQAVYNWLCEYALQRSEIKFTGGTTVLEVVQTASFATVITANGERIDSPVIVGADGYRSVVRRSINPEQPYGLYAGYLLWRGLVNESDLPRETRWPQNNDGIALVTKSGYRLVAYPVAGPDGSLEPGERQLSFTWYDTTREALLRDLQCLSSTGHVLSSLNKRQVSKPIRDDLCDLARRIWPEPWRTAIVYALEHQDVFATPVAEYFPSRLHCGRLAILGDAAHVVSPATGRAFVAGVLDSEALAHCLRSACDQTGDKMRLALKYYGERRLNHARALATTSIEWSRAYLRGSQCFEASRQGRKTTVTSRRFSGFTEIEK